MKFIYAFGLILMLFLSACAAPQEAEEVTTPEPANEVEDEPEVEDEVEDDEEELTVDDEEVLSPRTSGDDVRVLGKDGFDPEELSLGVGATVSWYNDDEKDIVLTFFKDGKFYLNSDKIKNGERYEHTFEEAGEYKYWTLAYGVKSTITVS